MSDEKTVVDEFIKDLGQLSEYYDDCSPQEQSTELWLFLEVEWDVKIKQALAEKDAEIARLKAEKEGGEADGLTGETQDLIYNLCRDLCPDANIDGSGTDAGPLALTLCEIEQAIWHWRDISDWCCVERNPPSMGDGPVLGFNKEWIDADFNPKGVRECFIYGDGTEWHTAKWNNCSDLWMTTDDDVPTHWMNYPRGRGEDIK